MLKKEIEKNEKLGGLQNQIGAMHDDFEDMKRNREEARKQLEAKFADIHKKINGLKQDLETAKKSFIDSLSAYDSKFTCLINELKENVYKDLNEHKKYVQDTFDAHTARMDKLEKAIEDEKNERLQQTKEMLEPLRQAIADLDSRQKKEEEERKSGEEEIIRNINDNVDKLEQMLNREKTNRETKEK